MRARVTASCVWLIPALLGLACSKVPEGTPAAKRERPPHLVAVAAVERETVRYSALRTGTLRARRTVRIFNQEEGRITELPHFEGDRVRAGQLLARIDDALLRAELEKATANRRQAEQEIKRLRQLASRNLASEDELTRAATALEVARAEESLLGTRIGYTAIRAPLQGVVTERLVEPGDAVPRYTHLLTLSDPASLITDVAVSELLLPNLKKGDEAAVRIDALGDRVFAGRIQRIHPTVDPRLRTATVEIALSPVPDGARPGQLCRVALELPGLEQRLVPFAAVRRDGEGEYVYRLAEGSSVQRVRVRSGLIFGDRISVAEGLTDGDQVVVKGFLGLSDGKRVEVVSAAPDASTATSTSPGGRGDGG